MAEPPGNPWLVLIHQLPPKPAGLRVKVWRRLQTLGAVPIKNSVYVLPNTDEAREDFEWILGEIRTAGGDASLCEAKLVHGLTDQEVRQSFQVAREQDYRQLATDVRAFAREHLPRRGKGASDVRPQLEAGLGRLRKRLGEIAEIDFFGASGREVVDGLLTDLESRLGHGATAAGSRARAKRLRDDVQGRMWVTRT